VSADAAEVGSQPLFSVVKGSPTDEELAALLVVVLAARPVAARPAKSTGSGWSAYWRSVGVALPPGPDAWRLSSRRPSRS
jgi:hypothetical protein